MILPEFTPDQRARIKRVARDLLAARAAGKKCDAQGISWAREVLLLNPGDPPPTPADDDLPPELAPRGCA